jgi:hypothetical protein
MTSRLTGLAGLLTLATLGLLLAGCAAAPARSAPSTTRTAASPDPTAGPTLVPAPDSTIETTPAEPVPFEPPKPKCPAPPVGLDPPRLVASAGGATVPVTMGSSGVLTCSTSRTDDTVPSDPILPLIVATGGSVRFALPEGWRFLHWEGWDRPSADDGANVLLGSDTSDAPASIDVPAPSRSGDSILGLDAWVISADERTVAGISGSVLVRLP